MYGDRDSPTVGYGEMQDGDMFRRHIWNETWAFFQAMDAVNLRALEGPVYAGEEIIGDDEDDFLNCEDARDLSEAAYDAYTPVATNGRPKSFVLSGYGSFNDQYGFECYRRDASRTTTASLGSFSNLDSIISYTIPRNVDFDTFYDFEADGKEEGEIHEVDTDATPAAGTWTSPTYGGMDNPLTNADDAPCAIEDGSVTQGYELDIEIVAVFDFPTT